MVVVLRRGCRERESEVLVQVYITKVVTITMAASI